MRALPRFVLVRAPALLASLAVVTLIPLIAISPAENSVYVAGLKFVSIPVMAGVALLGYRYRHDFAAAARSFPQTNLLLFLITFCLGMATTPVIPTLNALLPPQQKFLLEGKVITQNRNTIVLQTNEGDRTIRVGSNTAEQLPKGSTYREEWRQGGLGFLYRWAHEH